VLFITTEGICFLQRSLRRCIFVESEAEESGSCCSSSDDEDTSGLDNYDSSFISDSGNQTHTDIQAKFLHSIIRYATSIDPITTLLYPAVYLPICCIIHLLVSCIFSKFPQIAAPGCVHETCLMVPSFLQYYYCTLQSIT
jgi:hypothetical protein